MEDPTVLPITNSEALDTLVTALNSSELGNLSGGNVMELSAESIDPRVAAERDIRLRSEERMVASFSVEGFICKAISRSAEKLNCTRPFVL